MSLFSVRPCHPRRDPEPGVGLIRLSEELNRLTPEEARELGGDLILAANASEAQWPEDGEAEPAPEFDGFEGEPGLWQLWADAGHLERGCPGWTFEHRALTCACGEAVPVPWPVPA